VNSWDRWYRSFAVLGHQMRLDADVCRLCGRAAEAIMDDLKPRLCVGQPPERKGEK
jgi:hypothetical protein